MNVTRALAGIACAFGLLCIPTPTRAQVVVLPIAVDGYVTRNAPGAPFTLDTESGYALVIVQNIIVNGALRFEEARALLEFDLSSIPTGATITGVSLSIYIAGNQRVVGEDPRPVSFFGYSGDGTLTVADGETGAPVTLFSGALTNHSSHLNSVGLDPTFVQNALDTGAFAGLNLRIGQSNFAGINVVTEEYDTFSSFTPAALTVAYTAPAVSVAAPEPSALCLLLPVFLLIGSRVSRRDTLPMTARRAGV